MTNPEGSKGKDPVQPHLLITSLTVGHVLLTGYGGTPHISQDLILEVRELVDSRDKDKEGGKLCPDKDVCECKGCRAESLPDVN